MLLTCGSDHVTLEVRERLMARFAELGIDVIMDVGPGGVVIGLEVEAALQLEAALALKEGS